MIGTAVSAILFIAIYYPPKRPSVSGFVYGWLRYEGHLGNVGSTVNGQGSMDDHEQFQNDRTAYIERMAESEELRSLGVEFMRKTSGYNLPYTFDWLGLPIIQYPQDIVACQEILWSVKPNVVIETGVARGGSLILSASILELVGGDGMVIGIDIDIRDHNRKSIETHPLSKRIQLIEGSSTAPDTLAKVKGLVEDAAPAVVFLDSLHTHDHVLEELRLYQGFVTPGSYLVVFDTLIEDMPRGYFEDKPWDVGNNPKTAVHTFLEENQDFEIDKNLAAKLVATCNHDGYLHRIR